MAASTSQCTMGDMLPERGIPIHRKALKHPQEILPVLTRDLDRLPNELLRLIALSIEGDVSCYCFGLCCLRLFAIIEEQWLTHITDRQKRTRVQVIGDNISWDDLPTNLDVLKLIREYQLSWYLKPDLVSQNILGDEAPFQVLEQVLSYHTSFRSLRESLEKKVWKDCNSRCRTI